MVASKPASPRPAPHGVPVAPPGSFEEHGLEPRLPIHAGGGVESATSAGEAALEPVRAAAAGSNWTFSTTRIPPVQQLSAIERRRNALIGVGASRCVTEVRSTEMRRDRARSKCAQLNKSVTLRHGSALNWTPRPLVGRETGRNRGRVDTVALNGGGSNGAKRGPAGDDLANITPFPTDRVEKARNFANRGFSGFVQLRVDSKNGNRHRALRGFAKSRKSHKCTFAARAARGSSSGAGNFFSHVTPRVTRGQPESHFDFHVTHPVTPGRPPQPDVPTAVTFVTRAGST